MVPFNVIPATTFRTAEFLANVRIYDNEPFVVIRNDKPFLIGMPIAVLDEFRETVGWTETAYVTSRNVQRGEAFGKADPELGKIYVLRDKGGPKYAFAKFMPFKTYPAVAQIFRDGKLFEDRLWEYYKPFLPPAEAARMIDERKREAEAPLRPIGKNYA